jgi:hypothetical protein
LDYAGRFQDEHAMPAACGQPVRQHAARGTRADHDIVDRIHRRCIHHWISPWRDYGGTQIRGLDNSLPARGVFIAVENEYYRPVGQASIHQQSMEFRLRSPVALGASKGQLLGERIIADPFTRGQSSTATWVRSGGCPAAELQLELHAD